MNLCFFSGEIISKVDFKFLIGKNLSFKGCKHISICLFKLKLEDGTVVSVKAYDNFADFCYRKLKTKDNIIISGRIRDNAELEANFCHIV